MKVKINLNQIIRKVSLELVQWLLILKLVGVARLVVAIVVELDLKSI